MFDLFFRPRERSLIPSHWYRDPRPRFSPVFSFDPHFSYRRVIIRIIREIEGGKKERKKNEPDEASRWMCSCLVIYLSRKTNERGETREREREKEVEHSRFSAVTPPLQPFHLCHPLFCLSIHPLERNDEIQNSPTSFSRSGYVGLWPRSSALASRGSMITQPRRTITIIADIEIQGNFRNRVKSKEEHDLTHFPETGSELIDGGSSCKYRSVYRFFC